VCRNGQSHVYTPCMTVYLGDFPAKIAIYAPYIYGSGQPYVCVIVCVCLCKIVGVS
jgi:hypothetical protein